MIDVAGMTTCIPILGARPVIDLENT